MVYGEREGGKEAEEREELKSGRNEGGAHREENKEGGIKYERM